MRIINLNQLDITKAHNEVKRKAIIKVGDLKSKIQTINEAWLDPNEGFSPHTHTDCEEIYFIQEGAGALTIDDQIYQIKKGDWIVIEQNEAHSMKNTSQTDPLKYISIRTLI